MKEITSKRNYNQGGLYADLVQLHDSAESVLDEYVRNHISNSDRVEELSPPKKGEKSLGSGAIGVYNGLSRAGLIPKVPEGSPEHELMQKYNRVRQQMADVAYKSFDNIESKVD